MHIGLISGAYPPVLDGIGDYTFHLAQQLARSHRVTVFTSDQVSSGPGIRPCFDVERPATIRRLVPAVLTDKPDVLILQFNPFSFGPRGWNPWLPLAIAGIRRTARIPVAIMFHETHVPPCGWKFRAMLGYQYPQFAALCRLGDLLLASCERWLPAIHRIAPTKPLIHLPVGSNLIRSTKSRAHARQHLGIAADRLALVVFGSSHISRPFGWIAEAVRALAQRHPELLLLNIGPSGGELRKACPDVEVRDAGIVPAERAGDYLTAADFMLAPFTDGLSTRRGSVVAALQHGLPVISTRSRWTDRLFTTGLSGLFLSPADEEAAGFTAAALAAITDRPASPCADLLALFESRFSWPAIAGQLIAGLESPPAR